MTIKRNGLLCALAISILLLANGFVDPSKMRAAGGFSAKKSGKDETPPTIVLSLPAPTGNNGWYNKPVSILVKAWDGESGIASKSISIGGSAWYKDALTIRRDGSFVIYGQATDKAGNSSSTSVFINIDLTPPTVDFEYPEPEGKFDWYLDKVSISLSGKDDLSGVLMTNLSAKRINEEFLDDSTSVESELPSDLVRTYDQIIQGTILDESKAYTQISGSGRYVISGFVMDMAGNRTVVETELLIDNTPPEISMRSPDAFNGTIYLDGLMSDGQSGVNKVFINFGNGWERVKTQRGVWSFVWETEGLKDGEHSFSLKVSDIAGNENVYDFSADVINHFWPIFAIIGVSLSLGLIHLFDPRKYAWQDLSTALAKYARMDMNAANLFGKERR